SPRCPDMAGGAPRRRTAVRAVRRGGENTRFAVVAARFNERITKRLVDGATRAFSAAGIRANDIEVHWVPGSFELPQSASHPARSGPYRPTASAGARIRGQ